MRDQQMADHGAWALPGIHPLRNLPAGGSDLDDPGHAPADVPFLRKARGRDRAGVIHLRRWAWAPWPLCHEQASNREPADILLSLEFETVPSTTSTVTCLFCTVIRPWP
jgi:hypothetical protein